MKTGLPFRTATLLLTDMEGFTQKTLDMDPLQVGDFLVGYRRRLESQLFYNEEGAQYFEHYAGDATASVFERKGLEGEDERSIRALRAGLRLLHEIAENRVPPTRMGLYSGKVMEAKYNNQPLRFGNSFSAASRLQELCGYFGVFMLMDRDVAMAQRKEKDRIACVGKITPKDLQHPIHMFTYYGPGVHGCPRDADERKLAHYVKTKNEAMECFCGNTRQGMNPNFQMAKEKLFQAAWLFKEITGGDDLSTRRIIEYISEHNLPTPDFVSHGVKIDNKSGSLPLGLNLFRLSQELLKALDREFYDAFVLNTEWESCFRLEWREKGEVIIERGAKPDGVYFLTKGEAHVLDAQEKVVATVREGDIFGEMAYFSLEGVRNATVIAHSDLVLYRISREDFGRFPTIRYLFERIAQKRLHEREERDLHTHNSESTAGRGPSTLRK